MKCPRCGFENPDGLRFCGRCATEIRLPCPRCGFENPANFRFCGYCAAPLSSQASEGFSNPIPSQAIRDLADKILGPSRRIEGERRHVTVLFVDISSFTPLAERLDPEDVYAAVDLYLRALVEQVHRYGGHVDKFTGDGLMALFGAPTAHENDPERALHAALGMQEALRRMVEEGEGSMPVALKARIGVNTGTAVVGSVGADIAMDYTALGDAVNVAARLEQAAAPGEILVSQSTYKFTHPVFEFQEVGALQVKGRQQPVKAYRLVGEKAQPGSLRGVRGMRAPLVGRSQEFAQLQAVIRDLIEQRQGGLVLITGDAGIGKSRLTDELRASLPPDPVTFLVGETVSYGRSAPYEVFIRLLRRFFAIEEREAPETARRKITQRLRALDPELIELAQPYLEHLMGLPLSQVTARRLRDLEPQQLRPATFLAVRTLFTTAAKHPLILVFEDLHWIDDLSLELMLFMLHGLDQVPLLLYGTTRLREGIALDRLHQVARTRLGKRYHRLDLRPLSPSDNALLIQSLLAFPGLPKFIEELITEKAEGNPFFTEELVGVLIDQGVFERVNTGWQVRPDLNLAEIDVPVTLDSLIMARVDSMGPEPRRVLQCASVLGRRFAVPLLRELLGNGAREVEVWLGLMEERGFIYPLPGRKREEFEFRHGLTRDCVYNSLLFRRRKKLHGQAAMAIERLEPERARDEPELLAHHYSHSDMPTRALPYLIAAGHRACQRFANREAIDFYERALALLDSMPQPLPEQRVEVSVGLGDVCALSGEYEKAVSAYLAALNVLSQSDAQDVPERAADVQCRLGRMFERRGDYDQALKWLDTGLATLDRGSVSGPTVSHARVFKEKGWVYFRRGNYKEALHWMMKALPVLEVSGRGDELASAYNMLVGLYYNLGQLEEAMGYAKKGLQLRQETGDTYGLARSYNNLGALAMLLGQWQQALEYLAKGLNLSRKIGYTEGIINAQLNMAPIYRGRGDLKRAEAHLTDALGVARAIGNLRLIGHTLSELGEQTIHQGNAERALEYLREAYQVLEEAGAGETLADTMWRIAWAYLELGEVKAGEEWIQKAVDLSRGTGSKEALSGSLRVQGLIHRAGGRLDLASESLQASIEILQTLGNTFGTARSQLELGDVYAQQALTLAGNRSARVQAEHLYTCALKAFEALGAHPYVERTRQALEALYREAPDDASRHATSPVPFPYELAR